MVLSEREIKCKYEIKLFQELGDRAHVSFQNIKKLQNEAS